MPCNCYYVVVTKCQSIRHIFVSTSKLIEMIYSDADFTVPQCVVKLYRLCNDLDFAVARCAIKSSTVYSAYICI
jgi:hypothetical protein